MSEAIGLSFFHVLAILMFAHNLADYPLQNDFLAQGKNRKTEIGKTYWRHCLFSHSVIHGGFVGLITGSLILAILESVIHAATDWMKCEGKISMAVDQTIHYSCKIVWAFAYIHLLV